MRQRSIPNTAVKELRVAGSDLMNTPKSMRPIFTRLVSLVVALACAGLACSAAAPAQISVPAGTVLPVRLSSSLSSRKAKPGQAITAHITQDVPLGPGLKIPGGARVTGHVVSVSPAAGAGNAKISIVFDAIQLGHSTVRVTTDLRALASPLEIESAQLPGTGPDRGTPPNAFTTVQVGGEVVYRGGGPVARGETVVGEPVPGGVLVNVRATQGQQCRGAIQSNPQPQALWLFSSDACGVYGYPQLAIAHAGRTNPVGLIVLSSTDAREVKIRSGSGMLLRVNGS